MKKTVENAITPEGRVVLEEALGDAINAANKAAEKAANFRCTALSRFDNSHVALLFEPPGGQGAVMHMMRGLA